MLYGLKMKQTASAVRAQTKARFHELYRQLNPEQKQAVDTIEGVVMVVAGPGTGKTQLLAMRIAHILQRTQMDPWNILCLTFTESGVVAMRERLLSIMGEAAYYVRLHTFHSFCNEIIQEHPATFAAGRSWQPLSDIERVELFESLLDALPGTSPLKVFGQPYFYLRDISGHVQSLKQEYLTPEEFRRSLATIERFVTLANEAATTFFSLAPAQRTNALCADLHRHFLTAAQGAGLAEELQQFLVTAYEEFTAAAASAADTRAGGKARTLYKNSVKRWFEKLRRDLPAQQALASIYDRYQQQLAARGRYDFEDMINHVIEAFATYDDLLAEYQEQFQYILVDEYQDTNGAQNEVVRLLGSFHDNPNICVVGDDKQSIYRFQGASLANMLDFYRQHQDHITVISLRHNYRSQPLVLAAAEAVIQNNQESLTKYIPDTAATLIPEAAWPAQALAVHEVPSTEVEEYSMAKKIAALVASGVAPADIAVIVRYHRDSAGIVQYLRQLHVPARLEAGEDALASNVVQQFLTLLELVGDTRRDDLLATVLHFAWLNLPPLDIVKVIRSAGVRHQSLWSVMADAGQLRAAGVNEAASWQQLVRRLAQWRVLLHNTSVQNFLSTVIREAGLLEYLLSPEASLVALPAMRRLLDEAKALNASQLQLTLTGFLAAVRRLQQHGIPLLTRPWQMSDTAVRVMTAHKAKGLEFGHVFLLRVVDRHWGNNPSPARICLPPGLVRYDLIAGQNNEDERRLFYVALTRAQATITLSYARHTESGRPTVPSLFIAELPAGMTTWASSDEEFAAGQQRLADSLRAVPTPVTPDIAAWITAQLDGYVMSVTHLTHYLTCPHLFYIRNLVRLPAARTVHQVLGTAVHGALKDFLDRYQRDAKCPTRDFLVRSFERHVGRAVLSRPETHDVLDVGRQALSAYFDQYASTFVAAAVGEFDFSSHGVHVGEAAITGKIDKLEWLDGAHQTVHVVDYKTGQPDGKGAALKAGGDYWRQLVFYKLLCDASPRFSPTMVSGEIDFVQPNRQGVFVKKRIEVLPAEAEELKRTITCVWRDIHALRFLDPTTWCGKCEYCVYSPVR